jgi:hypothetical protein
MPDRSHIIFAELDAMRRELSNQPPVRPLGEVDLAELLAMAERLERAHSYAAEMELGASGFDNTESMRYYSTLQMHLRAAAEEIAKLCKAIIGKPG